MIKKETIKKIKSLCDSEIKFKKVEDDYVIIHVPYDTATYDILIEGDTVEEQIDSFTASVNGILDDMIDHLNDCKL